MEVLDETSQNDSIWDRTIRHMRKLLPTSSSSELKHLISPDLNKEDLNHVRNQIDSCLSEKGGEVSARVRAAELGKAYLTLSDAGKRKFFSLLVKDYDVDESAIEQTIEKRSNTKNREQRQQVNFELRKLLYPHRMSLLSQFNTLDEGVKFLVDVRADLLSMLKQNPDLKVLDFELHRLFVDWFDVGFLDLHRITWHSSAVLLEKLTEYEAVHTILSWQDLKNRLSEDRRCYAYFHPRMPDEPLIFVEVALVQGINYNIHDLLDESAPLDNPENADTALFYSISNCQAGLRRVSFGNFLIKRVVTKLSKELPNIKTFATLSPIPGFRRWLDLQLLGDEKRDETASLLRQLKVLCGPVNTDEDITRMLVRILQRRHSNKIYEPLKRVLLKLCAHYLIEVKQGKSAIDRVANFHLSNGARVQNLNWRANTTLNGIKQSAGIMVNYNYDLDYIEQNHEHYTGKGYIAVSSSIKKLLAP